MRFRPAELKNLFSQYKAGDSDALDAVFTSEKPRLFDYLMRMTGQISKSSATVDEAIAAVEPALDLEETLQEVLVVLYKTARNFTIENWNADTSKLENSAYGVPVGSVGGKNIGVLVALEHLVRQLVPIQREVLILHERFGFSGDEVAEIIGIGVNEVEELFAQALGIVEGALPDEAEHIPEFMTMLLGFPIPDDQALETQNLSMVFKDLKKIFPVDPWRIDEIDHSLEFFRNFCVFCVEN